MDNAVPYDKVNGTRIGFLADTHVRQEDGSDLPQQVLDAFQGVDLIVHLGDMGQAGVLDRLSTVAPVLATRNARMDPTDGGERIAEGNRVLEMGGVKVGATFELASGLETKPQPGKLPLSEGTVDSYISSAFGQLVDVVAFGGTHMELEEERDGVLFFNPGSPTIPMTRPKGSLGTVAILDLSGDKPAVHIVSL